MEFVLTNYNIRGYVELYMNNKRNNVEQPPINTWNVSNVTDMQGIFVDHNDFNEDLSNWEREGSTLSNVNDMQFLFAGCIYFNQDISNWNVSNVTNMQGMFMDCISFNQPLKNWERTTSTVGNVANMQGLFANCSSFNQDISNWNVSGVSYYNKMFINAIEFDRNYVPFKPEQHINLGISGISQRTISIPENVVTCKNVMKAEIGIENEKLYGTNDVYDVIEDKYISLSECLKNINNIVFIQNKFYGVVNRSSIVNIFTDFDEIRYACKSVSKSLYMGDNIVRETPLFPLTKIGLYGYALLGEIKALLDSGNNIFRLSNHENEKIPAVASLQMLSEDANAVSALHCQEGSDAVLYKITIIPNNNIIDKQSYNNKKQKSYKSRKTLKLQSQKRILQHQKLTNIQRQKLTNIQHQKLINIHPFSFLKQKVEFPKSARYYRRRGKSPQFNRPITKSANSNILRTKSVNSNRPYTQKKYLKIIRKNNKSKHNRNNHTPNAAWKTRLTPSISL